MGVAAGLVGEAALVGRVAGAVAAIGVAAVARVGVAEAVPRPRVPRLCRRVAVMLHRAMQILVWVRQICEFRERCPNSNFLRE